MKKIFAGALAVIVVWFLFAWLCAGCAGTPQAVAYRSLAAVGQAEAAAMRAASDMQVAGKLAPAAWPQIAQAHDKFAPAYGAAVAAARQDYSQPPSATVIALAQTVIDLVTRYLPPK
jgi:hypothetical protein